MTQRQLLIYLLFANLLFSICCRILMFILLCYNRNYDELVAFCRAKSTPDPTLGEYGYVDLDFSPYRLRVTERMDIKNLEYGCRTLNKNHTDEWGKVTPAPKAFNTGLLKINSTYVNQWGKYRSVICAKDPQFCR